jgi:transposase
MAGGRPTKYKQEYVAQAEKLARLGATIREIAQFFEVSEPTIWQWQQQHPQFLSALKLGREASDDRVVQSLYRRAVGYEHDAVKIFQYEGEEVVVPYVEHIPPSVSAGIFWLKNRRPKEWRDKQEVDLEHSGGVGVQVVAVADMSAVLGDEASPPD